MRRDAGHFREHNREHDREYDRKHIGECLSGYDGGYDGKCNRLYSRLTVSLQWRDRWSIVGIDRRHSGSFRIGQLLQTLPSGRFDQYERPAIELNCGQKFRVEV